ncbi:MAG TPA: WecB/TagA/CpsF family glycosyltransferase, partial [Patescibacteria group bacterium]|nr:WecB/TagA/CpsF family glycosyltransferase [Patescibacteria group bacterium]
GGSRGVARNLARKMKVLYPGIKIVGTYCPPFRPLRESEKKIINSLINKTRADIVWCGLGCPKQEKWMADFRPRLIAPVLIGVGAGFDFLSGAVPLAPKFIQNSGFEWMFRMLTNPRKLIKRYLYVVPVFTFYVVLELLGLKKFSSDI